MDIRIGKYKMSSNADNIILSEITTVKEGKTAGQEMEVRHSYYGSVVAALDGLLKRKIKASEATTLEQLKKEIKEHRQLLSIYLGEKV